MKRTKAVHRRKQSWTETFRRNLAAKSNRYWTSAIIVLVLAMLGSHFAYTRLQLRSTRDALFQLMLEWAPRPTLPRFVELVLIGDEEFWKGDLAGRNPVKRDYLVKIIRKLVDAKVNVIALDFDTRLPDPASRQMPDAYRDESNALIHEIIQAAQKGTKIVLATPVTSKCDADYCRDPDIYQISGLCLGGTAQAEPDPVKQKITCGYIALSRDLLLIPPQLRVKDGAKTVCLDPFGLAVARADRPRLVKAFSNCEGPSKRYTNYIATGKFVQPSGKELLDGTFNAEQMSGKIVIVGANWSSFAAGRGRRVDLHPTPIGPIVGAALHANYVEAFLDSRIYRTVPDWALTLLEAAVGILAAILFAGLPDFWPKLSGVAGLIIILFAIEWLMLHEVAVFFDALVPVAGLGVHSFYDRVSDVPDGRA